MSISALLKREGHLTELVMTRDVEKAVAQIISARPDIVAFSTLTGTGDFEWSLEVAHGVKERNKSILMAFGGIHPTILPEDTIGHEAVDIICRGEGEFPMLELCDCLAARKDYSGIANLWVKTSAGIVRNPVRPLIQDLDILPFPDRDLYQKYGYFNHLEAIDVMAGRGCFFSCSYCMNTLLKEMYLGKGKFVRRFSPEYVVEELKEVKRKFKPKSFTFVDELFTSNKSWMKEFAPQYKACVHLSFSCSVTADTIDEENAAWLAEAGTVMVAMGVETGNEEIRKKILNKHLTNSQIAEAVDRLHKNGIKVLTSNIVGLPGETVDNAFETIEFNQKIKTDFVYFSVFQPYPQLPLTKKMEEEGTLEPIKPADFNTTFFKGSILKQHNINQLVNLHKFFFAVFRFPWLKPIVKLLIQLPPNRFFEQIFILSYGWLALSCFRRHPLQLLAMGRGNTKIFFGDKGVSR